MKKSIDTQEEKVVLNQHDNVEANEDLPSSISSIDFINKVEKDAASEKNIVINQLESIAQKGDKAEDEIDISGFISNPRKNSLIDEKEKTPKKKSKDMTSKFKNLFKKKENKKS